MHEVSLAGDILRMVEDTVTREGRARVRCLTLQAGALAGVEVGALRFALDSMAPGTCLEGAQIEIQQPPGVASCAACGATVEIRERTDPCPRCGAFGLRVRAGTTLRVLELIVQDVHTA
jgi:hydrogenase nickel incorporation protein HypA/HybF